MKGGTVREKGEDNKKKVCVKSLISIIWCLEDVIACDLELPKKRFVWRKHKHEGDFNF